MVFSYQKLSQTLECVFNFEPAVCNGCHDLLIMSMNPWRFNIEGVATQQSYRKHPCLTIMTTLSGEIKNKCDFDAVN